MRCLLLLWFAACPLLAEEPADKGPWFGLKVLPKKEGVRIGDWVDGKQIYWEPHNLMNCTVREDRGGFLRVYDGRREGWVDKDDMVTAADAPAWFDAAVKSHPEVAYNWHMRGLGWNIKGEYDNAIKDFTEAIRLAPSGSAHYISRGIVWHAKHDYDRAIKDYDEALRLDPNYALAYNNRGNVWSSKHDYDRAIKDYDEALRLQERGWVDCQSLQLGDKLLTELGTWLRVDKLVDTGLFERVYNFRVAECHTYFVGAPEWGFAVWVHNDYHHIVSKYKNLTRGFSRPWTVMSQQILKNAGIGVNSKANLRYVNPHKGRHPELYHQRVYKRLEKEVVGHAPGTPGYQKAVQDELDRIHSDIAANPIDRLQGIGL